MNLLKAETWVIRGLGGFGSWGITGQLFGNTGVTDYSNAQMMSVKNSIDHARKQVSLNVAARIWNCGCQVESEVWFYSNLRNQVLRKIVEEENEDSKNVRGSR